MPKSYPAELFGDRCKVPYCRHREACSYRFSRYCMLRRTFLEMYIENKRRYFLIRGLLDPIHRAAYFRKVYFWKMGKKNQHGGKWRIPVDCGILKQIGVT